MGQKHASSNARAPALARPERRAAKGGAGAVASIEVDKVSLAGGLAQRAFLGRTGL